MVTLCLSHFVEPTKIPKNMNQKPTRSPSKMPVVINLTEFMTGMSSKRIQVKKRQFIRNLLKTNKNLLESNNINSISLF